MTKFEYLTVAKRRLDTPEWVREVAETPDSDLRAHRIALTYSRYGAWLDEVIFGEASVQQHARKSSSSPVSNANWFHFATWGTLTVTQNIALQRAPQRLNAGPAMAARRALTPLVVRARAAQGQFLGRALAWGQRLIFVSACLSMIRFSKLKRGQDFELPRAAMKQIQELSEWNNVQFFEADAHGEPVERAFRWLAKARDAQDATAKARLVLGATILLTAVEQDLVDPALSIVVDQVPARLAESLERRVARWAFRLGGVPTQVSALVLPFRYTEQRTFVESVWSRLMTDQVMVMALPRETLRLGRDIPPLWRASAMYPLALRDLHAPPLDPPELKAVADLVDAIDRTVGDGRGSAARDWRRWDERMNWAVTLFRSRQRDPSLFWSPYSVSDAERIARGELPERTGDPSALEVMAPIDGMAFVKALDGDDE